VGQIIAEVDLQYAKALPGKEQLLKIKEGFSDYPEYRRFSAEFLLNKIEKDKALATSYRSRFKSGNLATS
jgi:hypothetical protein